MKPLLKTDSLCILMLVITGQHAISDVILFLYMLVVSGLDIYINYIWITHTHTDKLLIWAINPNWVLWLSVSFTAQCTRLRSRIQKWNKANKRTNKNNPTITNSCFTESITRTGMFEGLYFASSGKVAVMAHCNAASLQSITNKSQRVLLQR